MDELKELKRLIATSYGIEDRIFALHPSDIQASQNAIKEAFRLELGFQEYLNLHKEFLINEGVNQDHIEEQLKNVKNLYRYFIGD